MSNQKRLSQVSLAAIALLAAALPCLAQTESIRNRNVTVQATEVATLRDDHLGVRKTERKSVSDKSVNASAAKAARDKFDNAIAQVTSTNPGFMSSPTISANEWQKTQRLSNQSESTSSKSFTFVPSRGQKLPD
jgi:hypothetical protein